MSNQPEDQQPTELTMRPHMIRGSIWMVVLRWTVRSIGLISTIVLARLLTPEDFGLVAMAMLAVALIEIFGESGQQLALIRHTNPTREHFDSAWTAQILVSLVLGTTVLLAAPLAAIYFDEPRTTLLVQVLSIRVYAIGFENIGTVLFRKQLEFTKEFRYGLLKKLVSFAITLALAFSLRNYWALVGGTVLGQMVAVVISYVVHPYRPRLCFAKIKEIWSFSIWIMISGIGGFMSGRIDQYIVGGLGAPRTLGYYTVGGEIAFTPSAELIWPMSRALFPAYAKLKHDVRQLADAYLKVLSVVAILATSTATGLALVADDLVLVVLGPQWAPAAPFIFWLTLSAGVIACNNTVLLLLQAAAEPRVVAFQSWMRVLIAVPFLIAAAQWTGPEGIAATRLAAAVVLTPTFFYQIIRLLPVSARDIWGVAWRPLAAAIVMAGAVTAVATALAGLHPALRLAVIAPAGAIAYLSALTAFWLASGRPSGAERAGLAYLADTLVRLRR